MIERRRQTRHPLDGDVPVVDDDNGEHLGMLVDLTREGLMLCGERRIPVGRDFRLRLMPPQTAGGAGPIRVCVHSLWTCRQPHSQWRLSGLGELAADDAALAAIDRLIAELGRPRPGFAPGDVIGVPPRRK